MKKHNVAFLVFISCLYSSFLTAQTCKLSDLELIHAWQQYGAPSKNKAVTGETLQVAGVSFSDGLGVHAESRIKLKLTKKSHSFSCKIGINDQMIDYKDKAVTSVPLTDGTKVFYRTSGSSRQFAGIGNSDGELSPGCAVFRIVGDGKELYNSGLVKAGETAREVILSIPDIDIMELIVEAGEEGCSGTHANWLDGSFTFTEAAPRLIDPEYVGEASPMSGEVSRLLSKKIERLPEITLPLSVPEYDWLLNPGNARTSVCRANEKDIVLTNGLVSRMFRVMPNIATVDFRNEMTGESLLRAVCNEGMLTIDGKVYPLGGLGGQKEFAYTRYDWIDEMTVIPNSFRVTDFVISDVTPRIRWAQKRWALVRDWKPSGKELTFHLEGPGELCGVKVRLHYVLYDGIPTISKWIEIENLSGANINLDEFTLEQLAMAEPESPVETLKPEKFMKPNVHIESDWAFLGFTEREADRTEHWNTDPRYTSQCNYPMVTPCLLEVKLPMGPDVSVPADSTFTTFRTWIMPFDSDDRERKGLFVRRMYRTIAPWITENPIFMHCTSSDPAVVREAIDQCKATGYEMVILSFGSGLNMEDESPENIRKFKELKAYADSQGIELGGYSLLSSRWISDEVDVINPETGKRGGMIFGSSPCLSSDWGKTYFSKIRNFFEQTGMSVFENDGSYPGNVCASEKHADHKGLKDSQWQQRKEMASLYQWMCENGIYTNVPDAGYLLNGSTKVGIGYREVNWSLPRERQLVLGRQVMYDGLWERLPGTCWTFVPLTQYHGGGAAATLEPLKDHLKDYVAHMMQNYGSGVQACYRGHRLYDCEETQQAVINVIDWYKKYRDILNSEVLHLRRPDGKDYDGIMHVNPHLKEKGLVMLYNPTTKDITRTVRLPLYYTSLSKKASIREKEGKAKTYLLSRTYDTDITVSIPAQSYTWLVVE